MGKVILLKLREFFRPELNRTREFINGYAAFYEKIPIYKCFPGRYIFTLIFTLVTLFLLTFFFAYAFLLVLNGTGEKIIGLASSSLLVIGLLFMKDIAGFVSGCIFKPRIVIDKEGKDLYSMTEHEFDYESNRFGKFVDRLLENGFNLEYYDESEMANDCRNVEGEWVSISNTFIGSLIRLGDIDKVSILLAKGVKVDERENMIEMCLHWGHFEMAELLIRNKVKSNFRRPLTIKVFPPFVSEDSVFRKYILCRLEAIAELMHIEEDEGEKLIREKMKAISGVLDA